MSKKEYVDIDVSKDVLRQLEEYMVYLKLKNTDDTINYLIDFYIKHNGGKKWKTKN